MGLMRQATAMETFLAEVDSTGAGKPPAHKIKAQPATFNERIAELDALMESGDWIAAEQKARHCIERHSRSAGPWRRLGHCLLRMRRYAEAQDVLLQALARDPATPPAYIDLATVSLELKRFEVAVDILDKMEATVGRSVAAGAAIRKAAEKGLREAGWELDVADLVRAFESAVSKEDWARAAEVQLAIQAHVDELRESHWNESPLLARAAYLAFNPASEATARAYEPRWIDAAVEFDFVSWPRNVQHWIEDRHVADVGCGHGAFSLGFAIAGAKSYTGVDPVIDLDSVKARNKRVRKNAPFPCTPRQIAERMADVEIVPGPFEAFQGVKTFDAVVMLTVTEHLMRIEEVFEGLKSIMHPGSRLVFLHHNFYCWNGHHLAPRRPVQLDTSNPEQAKYLDWRHVRFEPGPDHYIARNLNRIRLDDLRALCDRHFDVEVWDERPSPPDMLARLTPEIRADLADYSERELSVGTVFVVAKPRG